MMQSWRIIYWKNDGSPLWGIFSIVESRVSWVCFSWKTCLWGKFPTTLGQPHFLGEHILLPDHGHHWVAISLWMPFWSKSKWLIGYILYCLNDLQGFSPCNYSLIYIYIYTPMYISIPTLGYVYYFSPTRPPDLKSLDRWSLLIHPKKQRCQ